MRRIFILILTGIFFGSCESLQNIESLGSWGFSPNGDGINELFILAKSDNSQDREMVVLFDTTKVNQMTILESKTSNIVYKVSQYHRHWWNGRKNNTGNLVPVGLYEFYLELADDKTYFGFVYVKY